MTTKLNYDRRQFLRQTGAAIAVSQVGVVGSAAASFFSEGSLPSLDGATGWLNSHPLTKADLRGNVALIDFWTYTCINWRRSLPYLRAWNAKYRAHGLVVVGVHTPEFAFEKNLGNVRQAVKDMKIGYPIAIDSQYTLWRAFDNEYWPALYLADAQGQIRYHKFGEGGYEEIEREIQKLLKKAGAGGIDTQLASIDATGSEAAADWADLSSQENYVGYERTVGFVSPGGTVFEKSHAYALPRRLSVNEWALAGNWIALKNAVTLKSAHGRIAYRFHARDLHLVMSPGVPGTSVRFRVFIDGQVPGAARGADVDEQGNGLLKEPRMYQLIRQDKPIVDRTFEIEFLDVGVEAFSFTFG